jgi:hypothetical protein
MNKPVSFSKDFVSATLESTETDSFGTRTLKIRLFSDALNETVYLTETQDEGSWVEPVKVLRRIVQEQVDAETKAEHGY